MKLTCLVALLTALASAPAVAQDVTAQDLAAAPPAESFYKLQASDKVVVKYRYTPEYDATTTIRPDGFITLPVVGEVRVAGLTVGNARRAIVAAASQRLREPELTLELEDFQKPQFIVGGEVGKPGQYELRGQVTLLEAIAMAGGFKNSAKHSEVVLFRRYDEERAVSRVINAKALARPNAAEEVPDLRPGDFLFVPQNRISKVERFVSIATVAWLLNIVIQ